MEKLMRLLFGFKDIKFRTDDDFIDRMTRRYTVLILVLFSIIVTTKIYVGDPIYCWCPAQFTGSHKDYTYSVCWVKNTYYVPLSTDVDLPKNHEDKKMISYYQWVPLILVCQCLLCYLPSIVWRFLCRRSGLNLSALMDAAVAGQRTSYSDIHDKTVRYIVHTLDKYLVAREFRRDANWCTRFKHRCASVCCLACGKFYGNYLNLSYIFIKLLYVANAIGQLYALDVFMGSGFHWYGIEVFQKFMTEDDWSTSIRFPRVTMCDFQIRHMNQLHRYVVQCVLPINLFNEKIFMFVWFWFALLALISVINLLGWGWKSVYTPKHVSYIKRQLHGLANTTPRDKDAITQFTEDYLQRDGIFVLRLISCNVGSIVSAEVIVGLWENYGAERRQHINNKKSPLLGGGRNATHVGNRRGHNIEDV